MQGHGHGGVQGHGEVHGHGHGGVQGAGDKDWASLRWPFSVPSMNIDLEVQVLWGVGRDDPSEPQGANRERCAERSGERDLRGDVQESDVRRCDSGRACK